MTQLDTIRTAIQADDRFTGTINEDALAATMEYALTQLPDAADEDEDDEDEPERKTMWALKEARKGYVVVVKSSGSKSVNCGDPLATLLLDLTPNEVAYLADRVINQPDGYHLGRYSHLNPGQIRMNSGNRIRAAVKCGDVVLEDVQRAFDSLYTPKSDS